MKISDIYTKYKIMPQLQIHMYRVASVAKLICDNYKSPIYADLIIKACLVHDMGNIIKFDLERFPEHLTPEGLEYWENVKKEYITKYGDNEHTATLKIINELGLNNAVSKILNKLEFSDSLDIANSGDIKRKIVKYSDLRVTPFGIDTLENRLEEARKRYVDEKNKWTAEEFENLSSAWSGIESEIFKDCKIKPDEINTRTTSKLIDDLSNYYL